MSTRKHTDTQHTVEGDQKYSIPGVSSSAQLLDAPDGAQAHDDCHKREDLQEDVQERFVTEILWSGGRTPSGVSSGG